MREGAGWYLAACSVGIGVLALGNTASAATISLKAVSVDGVDLPSPTNAVVIDPGQTVTAEVRVFGWGKELPDGVRQYQVELNGKESCVSGLSGGVCPIGSSPADVDKDPPDGECSSGAACNVDDDCPGGACLLSFEIDQERPDFIMEAFVPNVVTGVDQSSLNFRAFATIFSSDGAIDEGGEYYAAHLILRATEDACGTFTWSIDEEPSRSFLGGPPPADKQIGITGVPLEVTVPCLPCIANSCAANCAVDARFPHDRFDRTARLGWEGINLAVSQIKDVTALTCSDFAVTTVERVYGLGCTSLTTTAPDRADMLFNQRMLPDGWGCIALAEGQAGCEETCIGVLPGDADASRTSNAADVRALVMNLGGTLGTPLEQWQCDIDRDGVCTHLDLIAEIDVLLGADAFAPWMGASLGPCPTAGSTIGCGDLPLP